MSLRNVFYSVALTGVLVTAGTAQQPVPVLAPAAPSPIAAPAGQSGGFGGFAVYGNGANVWGASSDASRLAHNYAKAEKEETKQEIRKELNDLLSKQFDDHNKQQQKSLEELEKQIETIRATLRKRADHKSEIISRRLEQLLLDADGMGWNSPNTPNFYHPDNLWSAPMAPTPLATPVKP